ncbi:MAG: sigma-70 family RNA polymerase sigma factor [Planctomycetes bacterium]|nr:sigma-70 family RNA polymerase sigma factor [Planctomycetota bacterium]
MSDSSTSFDPRRHEQFMRHFTANQRNIYLYIRSLTPHAADVEDIFQQTNLVLWQKFDTFDPAGSAADFRAWAFRIAHFELLNHRSRCGKGGVKFSDAFVADMASQIERESEVMEARLSALSACLAKLPDHDRRVIQSRYSSDASGRSVAMSMGRSPHWVYKAVSRIRRTLLDCVQRTLRQEGVL